MSVTKKEILDLLQSIQIPSEKKNLMHVDVLKDFSISGLDVKIKFSIKNPTLQFRKKIESQISNFIQKKSPDSIVDIEFIIENMKNY